MDEKTDDRKKDGPIVGKAGRHSDRWIENMPKVAQIDERTEKRIDE